MAEAVWRAAAAGDADSLSKALVEGEASCLDLRDDESTPLLVSCALRGHGPVVRVLLGAGYDPNLQNPHGCAPIHAAARNGHLEVLRILLTAPGIDVNAADEEGWTALHYAVWHHHNALLAPLLEAGANVHFATIPHRLTPLHLATHRGNTAALSQLIQRGASLAARSSADLPPLRLVTVAPRSEASVQASNTAVQALMQPSDDRNSVAADLIALLDQHMHLPDSEGFSDCSLVCSDGVVRAHRFVLAARSPYWRGQLQSGVAELRHQDVSCDVMRMVLRYFYGGVVTDSLAPEALRLARALAAPSLQHALEHSIALRLRQSPTDAADIASRIGTAGTEALRRLVAETLARHSTPDDAGMHRLTGETLSSLLNLLPVQKLTDNRLPPQLQRAAQPQLPPHPPMGRVPPPPPVSHMQPSPQQAPPHMAPPPHGQPAPYAMIPSHMPYPPPQPYAQPGHYPMAGMPMQVPMGHQQAPVRAQVATPQGGRQAGAGGSGARPTGAKPVAGTPPTAGPGAAGRGGVATPTPTPMAMSLPAGAAAAPIKKTPSNKRASLGSSAGGSVAAARPSPTAAPVVAAVAAPSPAAASKGQPMGDREALAWLAKAVDSIFADKFSFPFQAPVDPVELKLPDYLTIIKEPMDLGTIRTRLQSNFYTTPAAGIRDVRLVFNNAMTYNHQTSDIYKWAMKLHKGFERKVTSAKFASPIPAYEPPNLEEAWAALSTQDPKRPRADADVGAAEAGVLPPAPAGSADQSGMSFEEKRVLGERINMLEGEQLVRVVEIIESSESHKEKQGEEIEIDMNELDEPTLRILAKYVDACLGSAGSEKRPLA